MKDAKKYIPNILTSLRIIFTPIIIFLGLTNHYMILIGLAAVIAFTDFLDGFLARKWKVTSETGAKLDMIADKMLAISLLIILIIKNHAFFYVLILECLIAVCNIYFYYKRRVAASLLVGKLKTWIIFITIILGFVGIVLNFNINIFIYITVVWQVVTLLCYTFYYFKNKNVKKKELKNKYKEYFSLVKPILENEEFQKRKEFPHHINESVYAHVLRVSLDCYRIGKRFHLDYESLAVAGLLHDFYEHPWQYNPEKKPLLQKHAFTHAKNAVENAKKIFGEKIVTPKVEEIMITHMFPINKKFPKSKEAWLITLVDKADSVDFIMHPIALLKIFMKIGGKEELEKIKEIEKRNVKQSEKKSKKL